MANEIRLRRNNISGAITDNPLSMVSTTINSPSFVDLPTVAGTNHLILVLDPLEVNGQAEIVMVTAHTAAATVVTVTRGVEGSTPRAHISGTTWFYGPVASDYILSDVTSATRPTIPYRGELLYETDTDRWTAQNAAGVWIPAPHNVPACAVYNNADISIPNNVATALTFNTERFDTDSMHSTSVNTNRITINTAGLYYITTNVRFTNVAGGVRDLIIRLNGTNQVAYSTSDIRTDNFWISSTSVLWKCIVGDFFEVMVAQTTGGAINVNFTADYSPNFSAVWVGVG